MEVVMKCVCPMGGERDCPDNCTYWRGLPQEQRQPIVIELAEKGCTQKQIAKELNMNQATISRDLEGFMHMHKPHRPKGGRPRGAGAIPKGKRVGPQRDRRIDHREAARLVLDEGLPYEQAAERCDVTLQVVRASVQREEGRREGRADPEINSADLSPSAQQKFDAAIRQHKRKLDAEFESRVLEECNKRLNELSLPAYIEEMAKLEHSITSRKGVMTQETFKLILRCLHPDKSASAEKHNKAFHEFNSLEKRLLNEKESPTIFRPMPKTAAEMMAMRKSNKKKPATHPGKKRLSANATSAG